MYGLFYTCEKLRTFLGKNVRTFYMENLRAFLQRKFYVRFYNGLFYSVNFTYVFTMKTYGLFLQ